MSQGVQTSARDFLQTLVECDRYKDRFKRGLSTGACLRRQVERQRGVKPGTLGPAKFPACSVCLKGMEIATIAASVGAQASACAKCGAALIGDVACEACAAAAMEDRKAGPATGFLPPSGAPPSTRIWAEDAPDAPIGPPPASPTRGEEAAAAIVARVRKPQAAPWAEQGTRRLTQDNQEPATPAEEETVAGKTCSKCGKDLRADNTAGICGDQTGCRARVAAKAGRPALPARPKAAKEPKTLVRVADSKLFDVKAATVEQLAATIEACSAELAARAASAERAEARLKQVAEAIGEAA